MTELSIMIPTYNRKNRLNKVLDALEKQTNQNFDVFISDNCSPYDVSDVLKGRSEAFKEKIEIHRNASNIGSNGNIANLFLHAKTKWIWLMGDDDLPMPDAVEIILNDIRQVSDDTGIIHYPIFDISYVVGEERIRTIGNLSEFIRLYQKLDPAWNKHISVNGDLIFLSNKVYNMEVIGSYLEGAFNYSYLQIPQLMPAFRMLDLQGGKVQYINSRIVKYIPPDGDHWDIEKTALALSTFSDVKFDLPEPEWSQLCRIVTMDGMSLVQDYYNGGKRNPYYIKQLYERNYRYCETGKVKRRFRLAIAVSSNEAFFRLFLRIRRLKHGKRRGT